MKGGNVCFFMGFVTAWVTQRAFVYGLCHMWWHGMPFLWGLSPPGCQIVHLYGLCHHSGDTMCCLLWVVSHVVSSVCCICLYECILYDLMYVLWTTCMYDLHVWLCHCITVAWLHCLIVALLSLFSLLHSRLVCMIALVLSCLVFMICSPELHVFMTCIYLLSDLHVFMLLCHCSHCHCFVTLSSCCYHCSQCYYCLLIVFTLSLFCLVMSCLYDLHSRIACIVLSCHCYHCSHCLLIVAFQACLYVLHSRIACIYDLHLCFEWLACMYDLHVFITCM